jgi:uncharacterized protein YndB with AHSA1/START domain
MARIEGEITIARPIEVVFDYVADQSNEPQYNPSMVRAEKVTAGPIRAGTTFRSAVRSAGRTADMVIEVTRYDRPTLLASCTTMEQADIDYILRFEPVPAVTRMRWCGEVQPKGALRLLGPAVGWAGGLQEQRIWQSMRRRLEDTPWLGIATGTIGIASEILRPVLGWAYAGYGLLLFVWLAWVAVALWRPGWRGRRSAGEEVVDA